MLKDIYPFYLNLSFARLCFADTRSTSAELAISYIINLLPVITCHFIQ
jgi:hypothetical protein